MTERDVKRAAVAGDWPTVSIRELARRCEILIAEEQEKPLPDNTLIACLCDCVRMTREFERFPPIRSQPHCQHVNTVPSSAGTFCADCGAEL